MTPVLIVFGGLPGVGKTTIAKGVAAELRATYLRIDVIERALTGFGVDVEGEGYEMAYVMADSNLRLGLTVVADSVNPDSRTREAWRGVARAAGARLVEVEVVCADAAEHRRRVESREIDIPGFTPPTWDEVVNREYEPWEGTTLVVDTAVVGVDDAVAAAVAVCKA